MGLFRGQFGAKNKSNHVFVTNHPVLIWAGLGSFTLADIDIIGNNQFHQQNIIKALQDAGYASGGAFDYNEEFQITDFTLIGILEALTGSLEPLAAKQAVRYSRFNYSTKKYIDASITVADLEAILRWYDANVKTADQDSPPAQLRNIRQIQNSLQQCGELKWNAGSASHFMKIHIGDFGQLDRDRIITQQGAPVFSDIPKTPAGTPFSLDATKLSGPGQYKVVTEESEDTVVGDAVVAPTRWYYDQTTGTWEYPATIWAKLLESLDAADINFNKLSEGVANATTPENFYDVTNSKSEAGWASALAMPLSIEQGNPDIFGPNMIDCAGDIGPEKIRVINRGPKSFEQGERVLCHWVTGEWVVMGLGEEGEVVPEETKISSNWRFAKYISSSSTYFMNEYGSDDSKAKALGPGGYLDVEEFVRSKFYQDGNINYTERPSYLADDFGINTKIMQSSIFDQLRQGVTYESINLSVPPTNVNRGFNSDNYYANADYPFFWGPVFKTGCRKSFSPVPAEDIINVDNGINTSFNPQQDLNELISDRRQVPAELAVNGPDSPVESYHKIAAGVNSNNFDFLHERSHLNYRSFANGDSNTLQPLNPAKVQFTALTNAFACMDDLSTAGDNAPLPYDNAPPLTYRPRQFRRMRNKYAGEESVSVPFTATTPFPDSLGLGDALTRGDPQVGLGVGYDTVPYDFYNSPPFPKLTAHAIGAFLNVAGAQYGNENDGAEVYGIITATNTVTRVGGGNINFIAGGFFGAFSPADTSTGNFATGIVNAFIQAFSSSGGLRTGQRSASWGVGTSDPDLSQFGDTALYVRIFDYHPPEQTVYIGPYFSVLHFNGGKKNSAASITTIYFKVFKEDDPEVEAGSASAGSINFNETVIDGEPDIDNNVRSFSLRNLDFDSDFRVPTDYNGSPFSTDTPIESGVQQVIPEEYWYVDTHGRGQLLTGGDFLDTDKATPRGGFASSRKVIGLQEVEVLSETYTDDEGILRQGFPLSGDGFVGEEIYEGPNGVKVTVVPGVSGGVLSASFALTQNVLGENDEERGEGFMPEDFRGGSKFQPGFTFTITNENGGEATLVSRRGFVYSRGYIDYAPRYHGFQRLTNGPSTCDNGPGTTAVQTSKTTQMSVQPNDSNAYDCFYFFRNDITHTTFEEDNPQGYDRVQYVDLTVS
tara:strand:- start:4088 stop:7585 length:3498 start_codon:yes stop_codon:yes gene_type:complete